MSQINDDIKQLREINQNLTNIRSRGFPELALFIVSLHKSNPVMAAHLAHDAREKSDIELRAIMEKAHKKAAADAGKGE